MENALRNCDVLIFVVLDIDAVHHSDSSCPEVCLDHVGKNICVVLSLEEIYDKTTSRSELDGSIGSCGTRMHVGVEELSALFPFFSVWQDGNTPIKAHPKIK
jgi:hypothetical protein